jgi:hypothetical protein
MRILLAFVALVTGFSFNLYSQEVTIRGFVTDKLNGEPVMFEKVKLLQTADSSFVMGALSDVNGFYSLPKVSKGNYLLVIENQAFNPVSYTHLRAHETG